MSKTIDLELTRAEVEVLELEARLRVVPMNDTQLSDALKTALAAKKERLAKLRTLHATAGRGKTPGKDGDGDEVNPAQADGASEAPGQEQQVAGPGGLYPSSGLAANSPQLPGAP